MLAKPFSNPKKMSKLKTKDETKNYQQLFRDKRIVWEIKNIFAIFNVESANQRLLNNEFLGFYDFFFAH